MKRLKFKKPFNGMDNAKKLIPESYKVDGNEFEITDGNETYRVKWSSLINEGIVLTSSNKVQINEDMGKMKHLMGFKSQETLGTVKGAERLNENKKFDDILGKTKSLIDESIKEGRKPKPYPEENPELKEEETSDTNPEDDGKKDDTLSKTGIAKTFKKFANTISKANFDLKERDLVTRLLNVVIKLAEEDKSVDPGVKKKFEIFEKELGIINESKNLREQEVGYEESGLKNPELADKDDNNEISPYEKTVGSAIEKAMNELDGDESITSDIDKENGKREPHVLVGPSGDIALHLKDENGDYILMNTAESIALEEGKYKYFHDQGYSIQPLAIVSDPYDNAEDLNYGVSEANKISHRSIRSGGMGGNLESNPYNNKEVKGRPQGKALRQASKDEIAYQLANMEPDKEAERQAVWDEEEGDYYEERANGSYEDLYEKKDRFDEVFEGIYEEGMEEGSGVDEPLGYDGHGTDWDLKDYADNKRIKSANSRYTNNLKSGDEGYNKEHDADYREEFRKNLNAVLKSNGVGYYDGYDSQEKVIDQYAEDNNFDKEDMSLKKDFLRGIWVGYD